MDTITKLKSGDFNYMDQAKQDDESVIVTLVKNGEGKIYIMHVWDLYGPEEEVLVESVMEVS